ncbi:dihydromonapterin reductase [Thiomicrorhabdus sp.]|uniref:dihydromonapterin reductase n=1 Tax=Thiomicrorhabdus sp. TaxID=2039724 RepID=UPI0035664384
MLEEAVFISGAGQRIGLHLAKRFVQQGTFPVVFTYRTRHAAVDELESLGATGIQVDFSEDRSVEELLALMEMEVKSLRAVIHNASLWANDAMIEKEPSLYADMFRLHVEVPYRLNLALQPYLKSARSPLKDIISLSDSSAAHSNGDYAAYLASKAALQAMGRNFAQKFAPDIKVNDIAPGLILFHSDDSEAYKQRRLAHSSLGVEPGPDVIWQAVQYLMNSPYTTGVSLPVDGGRRSPL